MASIQVWKKQLRRKFKPEVTPVVDDQEDDGESLKLILVSYANPYAFPTTESLAPEAEESVKEKNTVLEIRLKILFWD